LVLLVTALVAHAGVPAWEESLFHRVYALPAGLDTVLWLPMQLGTLVAPFVVAGAAWIAWRRWRPSVGALVVGIAAWLLAKMVKDVVDRGRPASVIEGIVLRTRTPTTGLGFVSGHTSVAFGLATVVSPYFRRRSHRIVAFALATTVAFARVHLGAHLPLDVVGGASLGCLLGWCWHLAVGVPDQVDCGAAG
jgi:glycosyltransferase 2 family protein